MNNKLLVANLKGEKTKDIPIWFLRQAGRHIPEYYSIRSKANNFIDFCLNTDLIVESTKLPLKYYNIDAAIVFSDILMIPWAMKRDVKFVEKIGPTMKPMIPDETLIPKNVNIAKNLEPLGKAIQILRHSLPETISLIGFAGAPWTLACYMIEGGSSKDFINTRKSVWNANKWFTELIEILTELISDKLEMQAKAGADVLMIFDSWSHMIPNNFFENYAINPIANIVNNLRSRKVATPIIGFPFKAGSFLTKYSYESKVDCIALDWGVDLNWAVRNINSSISIQGNLDPAALISKTNSYLEDSVVSILNIMKNTNFIFNVGHGLTPECKIKNIQKVIDIVKYSRV